MGGFLEAFTNYFKQVHLDHFGTSNKMFKDIFSHQTEKGFMDFCSHYSNS